MQSSPPQREQTHPQLTIELVAVRQCLSRGARLQCRNSSQVHLKVLIALPQAVMRLGFGLLAFAFNSAGKEGSAAGELATVDVATPFRVAERCQRSKWERRKRDGFREVKPDYRARAWVSSTLRETHCFAEMRHSGHMNSLRASRLSQVMGASLRCDVINAGQKSETARCFAVAQQAKSTKFRPVPPRALPDSWPPN